MKRTTMRVLGIGLCFAAATGLVSTRFHSLRPNNGVKATAPAEKPTNRRTAAPPPGPTTRANAVARTTGVDPAARARLVEGYGRLPLSFERNDGQTDPQVKFLSRGRGYTLFLTGNEVALTLGAPKGRDPGPAKPVAQRSLSNAAAFPFFRAPVEKPQPRLAGAALQEPSPTASVLGMKLVGANPAAKVTGQDELPGKSNYFIGNDPKKWRTNVPSYAKVKYEDVYPGVDLVYYGNQGKLEYDFVVAPGADPNSIMLAVAAGLSHHDEDGGVKPPLQIDTNGDLVIRSSDGEVRLHKPVVYQPGTDDRSQRANVAAGYLLEANNQIRFQVFSYDRSKLLVIDPVLVYSTYIGGTGGEDAQGVAVDSSGNAYVTGFTESVNFPTLNPFQLGLAGRRDAFVAKLNAAGSALVYSSYIGGTNESNERGNSIAVDAGGNAWVTGFTSSTDFPTMNPIQATYGGGSSDAFVFKLNPTGSALVFSTYLGGSGHDVSITVTLDSGGNAYVTGLTSSGNFPTANSLRPSLGGGFDAFVVKVNPAGSALVYSTYLGGTGNEAGIGIAVDASGNAYVAGDTTSTDFPTANPIQPALGGGADCFVAKLNAAGSALVYSTYLGGSGNDGCSRIAVDSAGEAYVTGSTGSSNFPTTAGAFQTTFAGGGDAFVTKLNAAGSALVYSTFLGGSTGFDSGIGIAVDSAGNAYIAGFTNSTDFPTVSPIQAAFAGGSFDAFVAKLNAAGSALLFSTYLGGSEGDEGSDIALDSSGAVYVAGPATPGFPTTSGAFQTAFGGGPNDAFVAKISVGPAASATTTTLSSDANPAVVGQSVTFTARVSSSAGTPTGTVTFSDGTTTLQTVTLTSGQAMFSTSSLAVGSHTIKAQFNPDTSGFASSSATLTEQIEYGICTLYDETRLVKSGAAYPIKLYLCAANGADVSSSAIVVHATSIVGVSTFSGTVDDTGNANPDSNFRFDSTLGPSGGYIFNLSTGGLATGTYSLLFTAANDPVTHSVNFGVK